MKWCFACSRLPEMNQIALNALTGTPSSTLIIANPNQLIINFRSASSRSTRARTNSLVDAVPPRSPVRTLFSFSVRRDRISDYVPVMRLD
jgi:hypothetical protein